MRDTSLKITRTIVIENIPPLVCTPELIKEHFQQIEAYRDFKINDIQVSSDDKTDLYQLFFTFVLSLQLVYDVSKLTALSLELENVVDSRKFSEAYEVKVNQGKTASLSYEPHTSTLLNQFLHRLISRG